MTDPQTSDLLAEAALGAVDQLRVSAQVDDWPTFDVAIGELRQYLLQLAARVRALEADFDLHASTIRSLRAALDAARQEPTNG